MVDILEGFKLVQTVELKCTIQSSCHVQSSGYDKFASCKDKMSSQYLICPGMQALNLVHSILVYGLVFAVMCCLLLIQYTIVHVDAYQMHCDPSQTIHEDLKTLDES